MSKINNLGGDYMAKSKGFVKKTCCIAKTVMKKTQELFEISQLNVKIMQLKNKIERKFVKIGYCLYSKQNKDGFESLKDEIENEKFKDICKEIEEMYAKIEQYECELAEIKRYVKKNNECLKKCECEEKIVVNDEDEVSQEY